MYRHRFAEERTSSNSAVRAVILAALILCYGWYFKNRVNQSDFLVFYNAAKSILHGRSPYPRVGSNSVYSGSSFVYPYFTALLFLPFAFLSARFAEYLYVILSISAIIYSLLIVGVRKVNLLALFLLASATIVSWQMGTLNPFFMLGIALAWRYRDRALVVGTLIALVTFAKLFLLPLLIWLLVARRTKAFFIALGELALLSVLTFSIGPLSVESYLSLLNSLAAHEGIAGYSTLSLLRGLGIDQGWSEILVLVIGSALTIGMYLQARFEIREPILVAESLMIALIITPILWSSYLPLFGLAWLFVWCRPWAIIAYVILSWLVLTPDRAGMSGLAISLIAVFVLVLVQFPRHEQWWSTGRHLPENLRTFLGYSIVRIVLYGSGFLLLLTAIVKVKFESAMLVQTSLLILFPTALVYEQSRNRDLQVSTFE